MNTMKNHFLHDMIFSEKQGSKILKQKNTPTYNWN